MKYAKGSSDAMLLFSESEGKPIHAPTTMSSFSPVPKGSCLQGGRSKKQSSVLKIVSDQAVDGIKVEAACHPVEKLRKLVRNQTGGPGFPATGGFHLVTGLQEEGAASDESDVPPNQTLNEKEQADGTDDQKDSDNGYPQLNERQKKLFDLRLKMNEARKANQMAMVAEKNKLEAPPVSRGISKQKWLEERKKKIGKLLDANGLDMKKAYMLDTQEMAETKYKKWEKDPAPFGWDVFNQKTLYNAYKKRTKNIDIDMEAYGKAKEEDPEFYRNASSLQYGKAPRIPEENVERMVKELQDQESKRKSFSRRRRFHEEKDIDSINDRNEHFNKKIERAFGKYTLEIKNNLERGTALPD